MPPAWRCAGPPMRVIMGKTVTTEFANRHPGPTTNPHNAAHTPGGSSSGSAAAVADGHVPLAFGTQTGGSVIRPAAYCGVIGYKPTFGDFIAGRHQDAVPFGRHARPDGAHARRHRAVPRRRAGAAAGADRSRRRARRASASAARRSGTRPRPTPRRCWRRPRQARRPRAHGGRHRVRAGLRRHPRRPRRHHRLGERAQLRRRAAAQSRQGERRADGES